MEYKLPVPAVDFKCAACGSEAGIASRVYGAMGVQLAFMVGWEKSLPLRAIACDQCGNVQFYLDRSGSKR